MNSWVTAPNRKGVENIQKRANWKMTFGVDTLIKIEKIPKSDSRYDLGFRYTMNVNNFATFTLTHESAKDLRDNLNKLLNKVKE